MKTKNILVLLFILLGLSASVFFLYQSVQQNKEKKEVYQSVPEFSLPNLKGEEFSNKNLLKNKPVLFLFFDPDCGSCESEFKQIRFNQKAFSDYQLVFFSTLPADTINHFLQKISFTPTSNMQFLVDKEAKLMMAMEIKGPPTSLIYNREGLLIKRFDGIVKIETLLRYLSKLH